MQVKLKKCKECGGEFKQYNSLDKCPNYECRKKLIKQKSSSPIKKKPRRIKIFSDKQLKRLAKYRPIRDKYLLENTTCEVHDCNRPSNNLHHIRGRTGELLWNTKYFLACCHICHPTRIHENTEWSYKHGYMIKK